VQEKATAIDDDDDDDFRHEVEVNHGWLVRGIDLSGKVLEPLTVLCRSIGSMRYKLRTAIGRILRIRRRRSPEAICVEYRAVISIVRWLVDSKLDPASLEFR